LIKETTDAFEAAQTHERNITSHTLNPPFINMSVGNVCERFWIHWRKYVVSKYQFYI